MNAKNLLYGIGGLIIGLIAGFFIANSINRSANNNQSVAQADANPPFADSQTHAADIKPANPANPANGAMMPDVQETLDKAGNDPNNFAAQMEAGEMYKQIGRSDKAIEYYEQGVKIKPQDFQANVVLANAYFDAKQYEKAGDYYERALLINPQDANARADLGSTFIERPNPDFDRAIKELNAALKINPKSETTLYNLGIAYIQKGDANNARKTLTELEAVSPQSDLTAKLKKKLDS